MWISAVVVGVMAIGGAGASPSDVDRARDEVLDGGYQADLPRDDAPDRRPTTADDGRGGDPRRGDRRLVPVDDDRADGEREAGAIQPFGGVMAYLAWAFAAVAAGILGFWLARELAGYTGDAALDDADDARAPAVDLAVVERPLGDADDLARRGRYAEAIHTLLLRTLQELVRSTRVPVAPAQTSREILARVPLLGDARTALAGLITAVETTHFGGDDASADDYARCRQQFNVFATAFRAAPVAA